MRIRLGLWFVLFDLLLLLRVDEVLEHFFLVGLLVLLGGVDCFLLSRLAGAG